MRASARSWYCSIRALHMLLYGSSPEPARVIDTCFAGSFITLLPSRLEVCPPAQFPAPAPKQAFDKYRRTPTHLRWPGDAPVRQIGHLLAVPSRVRSTSAGALAYDSRAAKAPNAAAARGRPDSVHRRWRAEKGRRRGKNTFACAEGLAVVR